MKILFSSILLTCVVAFLLMLPDIAANILLESSHRRFTLEYIFLFIMLALLLVCTKGPRIKLIVCVYLGVLQLVATVYYAYFGADLTIDVARTVVSSPAEDLAEVIQALLCAYWELYVLAVLVICVYCAIIALLYKAHQQVLKTHVASVILILLLAFPFCRSFKYSDLCDGLPNPLAPSLQNILVSLHSFQQREGGGKYLPYEIVYSIPRADNIIVVMGESIRADYMSVFGYFEQTTPFLEQLVEEKRSIAIEGISSGVCTRVSVSLFFNSLLKSVGGTHNITTNLFKIAKNQGYKTVYVGVQPSGVLSGLGIGNVDELITRSDINGQAFADLRDSIMIDLVDGIPLGAKNFIVLHMRSQHSPYSEHYSHKKELALHSEAEIKEAPTRVLKNRMEYANAMRFSDFFVQQVVEYIERKWPDKTSYLFFTSDHGEMLGEGGRFGHGHLILDCARVPFLLFPYNGDADFMSTVKAIPQISHYDIALLIADRMGAEIVNPNDKGMRYVHGSLQPGGGCLEYVLPIANRFEIACP